MTANTEISNAYEENTEEGGLGWAGLGFAQADRWGCGRHGHRQYGDIGLCQTHSVWCLDSLNSALGQTPWCEPEQVSREQMGKGLVSMQERCFPAIFTSLPKQRIISFLLTGRYRGSCLWLEGLIQEPPWLRRSLFWHICQLCVPYYLESPAEDNWELVKGFEQGRDHGWMCFRKANLKRCFIGSLRRIKDQYLRGSKPQFPGLAGQPIWVLPQFTFLPPFIRPFLPAKLAQHVHATTSLCKLDKLILSLVPSSASPNVY